MNKQVLDKLDVERERGITVKAQTCTMIYNHKGEDYLLHLVDTPGHVDFRAEVSRSYASCGGALLLVDASQGVQAQTVANFYLAFAQGLELIPVINKVDLPSADPERALEQMKSTFELESENAVLVSAKTGLNVEAILPTVVDKIPAYVDCVFPRNFSLANISTVPSVIPRSPFVCCLWIHGTTPTKALFS
jgi:small GTP-binding protein